MYPYNNTGRLLKLDEGRKCFSFRGTGATSSKERKDTRKTFRRNIGYGVKYEIVFRTLKGKNPVSRNLAPWFGYTLGVKK